jgi:hypothetical protein
MDLYEQLLLKSYGREAADAYRHYLPSEADIKLLGEKATSVLTHFKPEPGACVMLSALGAAAFQQTGSEAPIYVVAGSLSLGGTRLFGKDGPIDGDAVFSQSNFSWDGHAWIVLGDRMLDISLPRTARSTKSPPALDHHVWAELGKRGPMVCRLSDALGLTYIPQYVLRDEQITGLIKGAKSGRRLNR